MFDDLYVMKMRGYGENNIERPMLHLVCLNQWLKGFKLIYAFIMKRDQINNGFGKSMFEEKEGIVDNRTYDDEILMVHLCFFLFVLFASLA